MVQTVPFRSTARAFQHDTAVNDPGVGVSDAAASFEAPHHLAGRGFCRRDSQLVPGQ